MRYAFEVEADAGMLRDVIPGSGHVTVFAAPTEVEQQELHDAMGICAPSGGPPGRSRPDSAAPRQP
jgi:hypothetical protein